MADFRTHLMLCAGTGCVSNKSLEVKEALVSEIAKQNLQDEVEVVSTGCQGFCAQGPIVVVKPDNIFYQLLDVKDVPFLVEEHFLKGRQVEKFMYNPPDNEEKIPKLDEIGFFKKQQLIALANRGLIDPEKIDEYIGRGGYKAAIKALTQMTSDRSQRSWWCRFSHWIKMEICSLFPGR